MSDEDDERAIRQTLGQDEEPEVVHILDGLDQIIAEALGISGISKHRPHDTKTASNRLSKGPPAGFDPAKLLSDLFQRLNDNWEKLGRPGGSPEKWRFDVHDAINPKNTSKETIFERHLAHAVAHDPSTKTANQVTVWKGRRAVDIAQRVGDAANQEYDLVELKIASNTPIGAAFEILVYGLLYVLARLYPTQIRVKDGSHLATAKTLHLKVVAPSAYYDGKHLEWLSAGLSDALAELLRGGSEMRALDLKMDFGLHALPHEFNVEDLTATPAERAALGRTFLDQLRRAVALSAPGGKA